MSKIILFAMLVFFSATFSASAHDFEYGLTHNHYDYVVIAEVESFDGINADLKVVKNIISAESCGDNTGDHIPPEKMTVAGTPDMHDVLKNRNIVAVVDETDGIYELVYARAVDSENYKTLRIINTDMTGEDAAFNDFINSGGKACNHSFNSVYDENGKNIGVSVTRTGTNTVIYSQDTGYIRHSSFTGINNVIIVVCVAVIVAGLWVIRYKKREKWLHWMDRDDRDDT